MVLYRGKPERDCWCRWLVGRTMRLAKNNLISIVGKTGSGKTLSAISICEKMSKMSGVEFTIDNIIFSLKELMELINSDKLKKGSCIIFDEPQVSISARDFQSKSNKVFGYLASTFRHRNFSLFFCTPFETLLDKNTRKLFHGRFETMSINRNNNTCRLKPRYLEHVDFKPIPYAKQMIVTYKEEGKNKSSKLFHWDVDRPSKEMEKLYEIKKLEFTKKLNRNIEKVLQVFDDSGKSMTAEKMETRRALTARQEEVMKLLAGIKENNRCEVAAKILGISKGTLSGIKVGSERKGYRVEEFEEE